MIRVNKLSTYYLNHAVLHCIAVVNAGELSSVFTT